MTIIERRKWVKATSIKGMNDLYFYRVTRDTSVTVGLMPRGTAIEWRAGITSSILTGHQVGRHEKEFRAKSLDAAKTMALKWAFKVVGKMEDEAYDVCAALDLATS